MANRFYSPDEQFCDTTGAPYALGTLSFFVTGSSTPLAVYSDATLSTSLGAVVPLDSAGRAGAIFLQNLTYKVILADANALQIWTQDPVSTSDVTTNAQFLTFAGNPNGSVAGTAGTGTVDSSVIWDRTNNILYVCTTTGNAAAAVWTAVNASAQAIVPLPQGRLTPTTGTPVITADTASATNIYYTVYNGYLVPVYNGSSFTIFTLTADLTLTLNSLAAYTANSLFDVFLYSSSGTLAIATGPAWSNAGNYYPGSGTSLTTGSASRGTGAGTTQLSRINGIWTNTVSLTARNGASGSIAIAANQGTYVGTIWTDVTAGQVTCNTAAGNTGGRKFGVWNAYNRVPIVLNVVDGTASWTWNSATFHAVNATAANSATALCGLPEEWLEATYSDYVAASTNGTIYKVAIGFASASTASGVGGWVNPNNAGTNLNVNVMARASNAPFLGLQSVTALEAVSTGSATYNGTNANMELRATYRG